MFAGFAAVLLALEGRFEAAALSIFVGMLLDALDGRVARLTRTTSEFGLHYDSLSDMLAFGVAPALVLHEWSLRYLHVWDVSWVRIGWILAFFYVAAVGYRLARFNTLADTGDRSFFRGLPSPAGAGLLMALMFVAEKHGYAGAALQAPMAALTLAVAALMASGFNYLSFKNADLMRKLRPATWFGLLFVLLLLTIDLPLAVLVLLSLYALSGPGLYVAQRVRRSSRRAELPKTPK